MKQKKIVTIGLVTLALMTACSTDDGLQAQDEQDGRLYFTCTVGEPTRGIPLETIDQPFSVTVFAFDTWDNSSTVPYFFNETVKKTGDLWNTVNPMTKPADEKTMRYYAWLPLDNAEVSLTSTSSTPGAPQLTLVIPDVIADQQDVLVAEHGLDDSKKAADYYTSTPVKTPVPLRFRHLLTQVRFVTGTVSAGAGTVKSIKLSNVKNKGIYVFGDDRPTSLTGSASYELTLNQAITGAAGDTLALPDGEQLMLMPQDPSTIELSIVYDNGTEYELFTTLPDDYQWNPGKIVTYALAIDRSTIKLIGQVVPWDESPAIVSEKITY